MSVSILTNYPFSETTARSVGHSDSNPPRAPPSGDRLCPRFAVTVPCFWSHLSTTELALPMRGKSIGLAIGWERDAWSDTTRHSHKRKRFLFNESQTCHHRDLLQRGRYDKTGIAKSPAFTHLWHPRDAPLAGGKLAGRQTSQTNENCLDTYFLLNPSRLLNFRKSRGPRRTPVFQKKTQAMGWVQEEYICPVGHTRSCQARLVADYLHNPS